MFLKIPYRNLSLIQFSLKLRFRLRWRSMCCKQASAESEFCGNCGRYRRLLRHHRCSPRTRSSVSHRDAQINLQLVWNFLYDSLLYCPIRLGAVHDGSGAPTYLGGPGARGCRWEDGYIMSDLRHTARGFQWSPCSIKQFHSFLKYALIDSGSTVI